MIPNYSQTQQAMYIILGVYSVSLMPMFTISPPQLLEMMSPPPDESSCQDAFEPQNVDKNRYKDIVPSKS